MSNLEARTTIEDNRLFKEFKAFQSVLTVVLYTEASMAVYATACIYPDSELSAEYAPAGIAVMW